MTLFNPNVLKEEDDDEKDVAHNIQQLSSHGFNNSGSSFVDPNVGHKQSRSTKVNVPFGGRTQVNKNSSPVKAGNGKKA